MPFAVIGISVGLCLAARGVPRALGAAGAAPRPLAIEPMTAVGPEGSGYFEDPYPVRLTPRSGARTQILSGTTKAIMSCEYPLAPHCFTWTPLTVDAGSLRGEIAATGSTITNFQNLNIFQDDAGRWQAVLAIGVHSQAQPDHWTVLVHAHPVGPAKREATPLAWSADTVLSGSFAHRVDGNYDGKYFEDAGRLFFLYVKNFVPKPALRNGIVIQPMLSPTRAAPVAPTTLLTPGDRYGPLASERYGHTRAKLVEAPYIVKIGGKYALLYSTGAYQQADYKAGVAWCDALMPPPGGRYRKVLEPDTHGIWGRLGRREVRYLLQSQRPRWPNFTGSTVIGPGVASAEQALGGAWWLYFAGFNPVDRPLLSPGVANARYRRPFFVQLQAAVPADRTVASVSDGELATWLAPRAR